MISQSEGIQLIETEFPQLTRLYKRSALSSDIYKSIQRLLEPVSYNEITKEKKFWQGCKSCVNYQTLLSKDCKNCFCTAMLFYTPDQEEPDDEENECETEHQH
ncbi:hypothetical protein [Dyadobacter psychrotolerans]|uniref:hypothetical protein n=1 Tax=Dyadobacter psychrotolerans TaxID=2541721 RepID=UPI0015F2D8DE|nr:hypothetical protein [Dyadobacter psychrotolerans]